MPHRTGGSPLIFRAGETILRPGVPAAPPRVYKVLSGLVRVLQADEKGNVLVLRYVTPGSFLGEEALANSERRYHAEAVLDTQLQPLDAQALNTDEFNEIASDLVNAIGQTYSSIQRLSAQRLRNRLAAALLDLAKTPLAQRDSRGQIVLRVTHDELASIIGSVRETTTKTIGELSQAGLVSSGYGRLRLLDIDSLAKLAEQYD